MKTPHQLANDITVEAARISKERARSLGERIAIYEAEIDRLTKESEKDTTFGETKSAGSVFSR